MSSDLAAPETAVVILNWNGDALLRACLSALSVQTYRDFEVWIVDNGSIDSSRLLLDDLSATTHPGWLPEALPRPTRIIRNEDNAGFAAGNNQAFRCLRARYAVALNNDAIAEPLWLEQLVASAESGGPRVGMVASTMLFDHRPDLVASAGISVHRDGTALDRALGMPAARLEKSGVTPVFGPSAGAALYRIALLRDVGLFDERYFSYLEDADLAWRARWRGWKAVHNPAARVRHVFSATGGADSPFKRRHIARNHIWTIYKNMPEALLERNAGGLARYEALALLWGIVSGDRASVRGRLEGYASLGDFTRDRRVIGSSARVHPEEMQRALARSLSAAKALKYRKRLLAIVAGTHP